MDWQSAKKCNVRFNILRSILSHTGSMVYFRRITPIAFRCVSRANCTKNPFCEVNANSNASAWCIRFGDSIDLEITLCWLTFSRTLVSVFSLHRCSWCWTPQINCHVSYVWCGRVVNTLNSRSRGFRVRISLQAATFSSSLLSLRVRGTLSNPPKEAKCLGPVHICYCK